MSHSPDAGARPRSASWPNGAEALLTGASSGLGRALLVALADGGARVRALLHPRHEGTPVDVAVQRFAVERVFCDLSDLDQVEATAAAAADTRPAIDTLVLCAGVSAYGPIADVPVGVVEQVIRVNYLANVALVKRLLPVLRGQPHARIIGIGSGSALTGLRWGSPYTASKAAFQNFLEALSAECRGTRIRVLHVMPGYMETPLHVKQPRFGAAGAVPPTGAPRPVEDVARTIVNLARRRTGNVFAGLNPSIAYHVRYWCPPLLRALARRHGY